MATQRIDEERNDILEYIKRTSLDSNIADRLSYFVLHEADSIQRAVVTSDAISDTGKVKAIGNLAYFIKLLNQNLSQPKAGIYDIPVALESYKRLLNAVLFHIPIENILTPLNSRCCQLLASTFWQYDEFTLLQDITVYKRIVSSPDHILTFLEKYPGFRFADSLLIAAAAYNPVKMASYLFQNSSGLIDNGRNKQNIYLQQIVSLAGNRDASELLPFIVLLAENKITIGEIIEKRRDATGYFQLLVNTLKYEISRPADSSFHFKTALRNAIREKSFSFYTNRINELHSYPDNIRFAAVKNLRIEDIYYIITTTEQQLYTSTYLGLYRRLMQSFTNSPADSIFNVVQYDNFHIFMRMAARYNTLQDFLSCISKEKAAELLSRFISGIESDTETGLEKAMDIADSFTGPGSFPETSEIIESELRSNFRRCKSSQRYFGMKLYNILLQVFDLVQQKNDANKLWAYLGNYEVLETKRLQNKNGEIIEMVLFYGDEDGLASFNNFTRLFADTTKWFFCEEEFWVTIRSLTDQPVVIYANLPLDNKQGVDIKAQDSLTVFLRQQAKDPVILMHRGHSYHLLQTLKRLQSSVKLAILGSCGGYNSILSVANISPDAQIIVSKQSGSKLVNDPLIDVINGKLLYQNVLTWSEIWGELRTRFNNDESALNLFSEYIPPTKNVSLFVLKLFNFYN